MIFQSDTKLLAVAGIVYALAAAAMLCQSVFAALPLQAGASEKGTQLSQLEQRLDMRVGACLLVIGFSLQMLGTLGTATLNGPAALLLLALAFGLIVYAMMRSTLAERYIAAEMPVVVATPSIAAVVQPEPAPPVSNLVELRPIKAAEPTG